MLKRLLILLALLGAVTCTANAQDTVTVSFDGGYIRIPAVVVTTPCPDCPPPPAWECPEGWTCTPPEPEPTVSFEVSVVDGKIIAEMVADSAGIADTRMVGFYINGTLIRNESVPAYCLGGGDASPCAPYTPTVTGELTLVARRYLRPDGTEDYTEVVTVNPNVPPEPPDSTPPAPGDSVPPPPPDSLVGQIPLSAPTNLRLDYFNGDPGWVNLVWDEIPESRQGEYCDDRYPDRPPSCRAVVDPDIVGDEVYYVARVDALDGTTIYGDGTAMGGGGRTLTYPGSVRTLPDTVRVCVRAEAWDALGYEARNPGGGYVTQSFPEYGFRRIVPVSETSCTVLTPQ